MLIETITSARWNINLRTFFAGLGIAFCYALFAHAQPSPPRANSRALEAAQKLKEQKSFTAATKAFEEALPALRSGGDRGALANALLEAGQSALAAGIYDRALDWAVESGALFHAAHDLANETIAANVAGSAQLYRGDYVAALDTFHHALELDRKQGDARGEISRLSNIGSIYFFQGKYMDALEAYEQGLRRVNETTGAAWNAGRRQLILGNLAILYEQLGQNRKALEYYQQAEADLQSLTPAEQGQLLSSIGTLYRRLGDGVKALETYSRARKVFQQQHLPEAEIHNLQNEGIARALDFNDLHGALAVFTQALELAEATSGRREIVLAHLFRGEAFYRLQRWKEAVHDFDEALSDARAIGAREEQWTALYGRGRLQRQSNQDKEALTTFREAIAVIESIRSGLGSATLKADFLADKRQVYDSAIDLMLRSPDRSPMELFSLVERARSRNFQDALSGRVAPLTLEALQAQLQPGSTLVEYWAGAGQVMALWITRNALGVVSKTWNEAEAQAFLKAVSGPPLANWRNSSERLGDVLLSGIPLQRGGRVMVVPDGALSAIPFELLAVGRGGRLLVEQVAVSYLPSAALLLTPRASRRRAFPWEPQLAAFGDPIVNESGAGKLDQIDQHWTRLPEAARELRSIARALPGAARVHSARNDLKRYLFDGSVGRVPLLHFSTHAVADTLDSNRSRVLFTPETGKRGSEYLFRREVEGLPFKPVDLVTLSACDTEGGEIVRGEGLQSFSRAFLAAGARSTVTTLWRVDDAATADFMRLFYQRLAAGQSKDEALRNVKLAFLRSGNELAQPRYWAAFVLNGDGQSAIPPVYPWTWVAAAAVFSTAGIGFIYRWAQRPGRLPQTPQPE